MRANYAQGVDVYYQKSGSTYRNLHFHALRPLTMDCLSRFWDHDEKTRNLGFHIVDLACGSGEITQVVREWESLGKKTLSEGVASRTRRKLSVRQIPSNFPPIEIVAADPYTGEAYKQNVGVSCLNLNFQDIADGKLPPSKAEDGIYDLVICSFALHLLTDPSKLFATCYALAAQCRWLLIVGPHKQPMLKPEWGWIPWNIETWLPLVYGVNHDHVIERVHGRFFQSMYFL
ncbi:methyltransferase [Schizosaccharomyces osmophilus]|uniref:Methyltransferase n=1 Tax=Schizosaccharomyces osmophilus TaxID=2545709 RepID=A0AAE9W9N1_9SCHI|nr:methyltransferase [Schizosaccharomyces osmophilus]WBW72236.1 methyltransferase [Schizosaccharomyces osmophilus]